MENGPFGQPAYTGGEGQSNESAPVGNQEHAGGQNQGQAPQRAPQVVDISTLEKFKFGDEELTPETLRKQRMMHQDYTNKTKAVAQERKFYENVGFDLDKVKKNPALADEFKKIYPKAFHRFLDFVLGGGEVAAQEDVR